MNEFRKDDAVWYKPPGKVTLPKNCCPLGEELAGWVVTCNNGTTIIEYFDHSRHPQRLLVQTENLRPRRIP